MSQIQFHYTIISDGGSRHNGSAVAEAYGSYKLATQDGREALQQIRFDAGDTNNVAEYTAVLEGLRNSLDFGGTVQVFSDSELVVKQLKGEYKVKKPHLRALYKKIKKLESEFKEVSYTHRKRENEMQKRVDKLVNQTLDR